MFHSLSQIRPVMEKLCTVPFVARGISRWNGEGEGEQDECININGGMKRGYRRLITPDKSQIHWNFEAERLKREEREINKKI